MESLTFITVYLVTLTACVLVTIGIISMLGPGASKYFDSIAHDPEISHFFRRLVNLILFMSGLSGALKGGYSTGEKADWLTLSWDVADQFKSTISNIFITLMIMSILFLILHVVNNRLTR